MIKKILYHFMGPRYYLPLMFFFLGLMIFYSSYRMYKSTSHQVNSTLQASKRDDENTVLQIQELKSLFPKTLGDRDFQIIASRNLFSPERKQWQPPQETSEKSAQDEQSDRPTRRISHNGIRLYGTTITSSQKYALMYFQAFQTNRKYRLVQEQKIIRDEGDRGEWLFFQIKQIDDTKVVLEDSKGESFEVGLYDHEREMNKGRRPPQSSKERVSVVIGGQEEASSQVVSAPSRSEETGGPPPSSKTPEDRPGPSQDQEAGKAPKGTPETKDASQKQAPNPFKQLLNKIRGSKNNGNAKPESSETRKIETPFGTIYRPVQ